MLRTLAMLMLFVGLTASAEVPSVLPGTIEGVTPSRMMETYFGKLNEIAFSNRAQAIEALQTPQQILERQARMRDYFVEMLGGFPERTPLNAKTVETIKKDGFTIEKILFESQPQHYVSAMLFLPDAKPPYPGVLVPCGHSANGKAYDGYQRACMLLALNGMAALIYDPIDQGERYQLIDENNQPIIGGTLGHTMTGISSMLLGRNTATYRIWDGMRALDYLCSRPEVNPERIGCTGNSGGGTLTSYLMALDDRITVAAPSCYLSTLSMVPPQDSEQDIYGQIAIGMDHADYIHMRAPKPTLMCCATRDFFPIEGTWKAFREAKRLYTIMGVPHHIELAEANEEHGFTQPLRQASVQWMKRWLLGKDETIIEPADLQPLTDEEALCAPNGQVMTIPGARSVYDLNREFNKKLSDQRQVLWGHAKASSTRQSVRQIAGVRGLKQLPKPEIETIDQTEHDGVTITRLIIKPEPGIFLPAVQYEPKEVNSGPALIVHGQGKSAGRMEELIQKELSEGRIVLAVDIRGVGETKHEDNLKSYHNHFNSSWRNVLSAYMLQQSYVGMRTEDILVAAQYISRIDPAIRQPVHLIAVREASTPALHAAFLEPGLFAKTTLIHALQSWSNVVDANMTNNQLENAIHGVLRIYDLPDLVNAIAPDKIEMLEPYDVMQHPARMTN
ncbi:MAG: acetylxylan esterase [Candidatus Hinthialibacter antarcticus]|nr:acetylxylan esterase [Candidatus Hinthialibacter antarcticus]